MRAFVTGGSGFLGRNLIGTLARQGHEIVALARSERAVRAVRDAGASEVVEGDLDAIGSITRGMVGCDVVFHTAALAEDWGDPEEFERVNVHGTQHVLDAARAARVPRLVHVSTEAVLVGGGPIIGADESRPLPSRPIGLYPKTKGEAERRVRGSSTEGFETVVVRPRFIWGRNDTSLLPKLVQAVKDRRFTWIDGGHYRTSTCHVDNAVEGTLRAAEHGRGGEVYFLTDGEPVSFRPFVTRLLRTQGVEPGDKNVPGWLARAAAAVTEAIWRLFRIRRPPPLTRTAVRLIGEEVTVNDAKARRELGYEARVSIERGLAQMERARVAARGTVPG